MNSETVLLAMLMIIVSVTSVPAFADHSEVTIVPATGSGAPGCEETADGCFAPSVTTVDVGGVVIMSNTDTAAHTFTAGTPDDGPSGEFDTSLLMIGNSFEWIPDTAGEVPYFCMVHPWMTGLIIVQEDHEEHQVIETLQYDKEKLEFAASLEEILGHFWALEQNLDDENAELVLIHATHPINELYDTMKPQLKSADHTLDDTVRNTLVELKNKATLDVSRNQAQSAIDDAKKIVATARSTIVGDDLSNDVGFGLELIKILLKTSVAEYEESIGESFQVVEFQEASAFVWRSQQIFDEIKLDLPSHEVEEISELYESLELAYDSHSNPSEVDTLTSGIIHEIDEITGTESEEQELDVYVETIRQLLTQTKQEYANGNPDLALSLATKAYLDNFEFLEEPLVKAGEPELMQEVEIMMREDLRSMIKDGAPISDVTSQIDTILIKMDAVEVVVPEFGTIAMMILAVAIISIVAVTAKSRIIPRF